MRHAVTALSCWSSRAAMIRAKRMTPRIAAIAPTPCGTACCMYCPRLRTRRTASAKSSEPAATSAEYSPSEWPAT